MIVRSYENRIPACSCKSTCNCIIKCSALSCLFSVLNRYLNCNFPHFSAILTLELLQLTSLQVIPPHIIFIFLIKILISISLCFSLFMNIFLTYVALLPGVQAYLAGLTFALAASPCSTPVLATLLGYVASSRV